MLGPEGNFAGQEVYFFQLYQLILWKDLILPIFTTIFCLLSFNLQKVNVKTSEPLSKLLETETHTIKSYQGRQTKLKHTTTFFGSQIKKHLNLRQKLLDLSDPTDLALQKKKKKKDSDSS